MAASAPIHFQELTQLPALGIAVENCTHANLTMESSKYIAVRSADVVSIVDLQNPGAPQQWPMERVESTIINPETKVIAVRRGVSIQVFNLEMKSTLKSCESAEPVVHWGWVSANTIGIVTATAVYHLSMEGQGGPVRKFDRDASLGAIQIIGYKVSKDMQWGALNAISKNSQTGKIQGHTQLYSFAKGASNILSGHIAAFAPYRPTGATSDATVLCFANRDAAGGSPEGTLSIAPVVNSEGVAMTRSTPELFFAPGEAGDFPFGLEFSEKHGILYVLTRFGYVHLYEIEKGTLLYTTRISQVPIISVVADPPTNGMVAVNTAGSVLRVTIDDTKIVSHIAATKPALALALAMRGNLPGAEQLAVVQFNQLMQAGRYDAAVLVAAASPQSVLRTPETVARFRAVHPQPGHPAVVLTYFSKLLERGKLNVYESVELTKLVLEQGKSDLLKQWLTEDKLECSEELGDILRATSIDLALSVYLRAKASPKVVQCFAMKGEFEKIMVYSESANYTPDWLFIMSRLAQSGNTDGAARMSLALYQKWVASGRQGEATLPPFKVVEVLMANNGLQHANFYLLEATKPNLPEDAALQTKLLEINLLNKPEIADVILKNGVLTHFDRPHIARLCEQARLYNYALAFATTLQERKKMMAFVHTMEPEFVAQQFSEVSPEETMSCIESLLSSVHAKQNLKAVVAISAAYHEKLDVHALIRVFEGHGSHDALFLFLSGIVNFSQDAEVHYRFIESAIKTQNFSEVERVCNESSVFDPARVRDLLMESNLPDQLPLIVVCDRFDMTKELTSYLFSHQMSSFITMYLEKVNTQRAPEVVAALVDIDAGDDFVQSLLMTVRNVADMEKLVKVVNERSRLKLLLPMLEQRAQEGAEDPATHNALAMVYVEQGINADQFLAKNQFYDSKVVGHFCESRDPVLAFACYKRGGESCDQEILELSYRSELHKRLAYYLVERQDPVFWALVLNYDDQEGRGLLVDQVTAGGALGETASPDSITVAVKAFMDAQLPGQLIQLLDKIVLDNPKFAGNSNLENLLILTAIRTDPTRVMGYLQRLGAYDGADMANFALEEGLNEEAFVALDKFEEFVAAAKVLLETMGDLDRGVEYAKSKNDPKVWSVLGKEQLRQEHVVASMSSFIRGEDGNHFGFVIPAAEEAREFEDLVAYLRMCRNNVRESMVDTELVYALAHVDREAEIETMLAGPHVAQIVSVAERLFDDEKFKACKILFTASASHAKLATTLVRLGQYSHAVEAARKANSTRCWREVCFSCVSQGEFRLAQIAALAVIVHTDEMNSVIGHYESRGYFNELGSVLEAGLGLERAHSALYTALAIHYSKYKSERLMEHIKLFRQRINMNKVIKACREAELWSELVFLYVSYEEPNNAATLMMEHPTVWEHLSFADVIIKANTDTLYRAVRFYLAQHPEQLCSLLEVIATRIDHGRVIGMLKEADHVPLIREFLEKAQPANLESVNTALNELYIEAGDHEALRNSISSFDAFDKVALASTLEGHESLAFRRVATYLHRLTGRYADALALCKKDSLWSDAMDTAKESEDPMVARDLLTFFASGENKNSECFAAMLFTCFQLLEAHFVMQLAFLNGLSEHATPFMIQTMQIQTTTISSLEKEAEVRDARLAALEEQVGALTHAMMTPAPAAPAVAPAPAGTPFY